MKNEVKTDLESFKEMLIRAQIKFTEDLALMDLGGAEFLNEVVDSITKERYDDDKDSITKERYDDDKDSITKERYDDDKADG